jgi:thiosulfate/3-mercaptopyruvate sulfurtransferase
MNDRPLITAPEVRARLAEASLVVFDCRYDLAHPGAGARAYAAGHVPGARFADTDTDLAGARTGTNGRHPLPDPDVFAAWLGRNGVDAATTVIAYDFALGFSSARLWWMLRHWLGHERVAVLDGGWEAWLAAGGPVTADPPQVTPARYVGTTRDAIVDAAFVRTHLDDPATIVIDARAAERYRGEVEPIDPIAGHIPGARNRPYRDNLDANGRFKPARELRAEFAAVLAGHEPGQVVHQCGSGVSACHNLLAMEIAGLGGSRLYPGSWSEWCADPERPIARD